MTIHRRALADWYPDPAERRRLSHTFAHEFLPSLVLRSDLTPFFDRLARAEALSDVMIANLWKMMTNALGLPAVIGIITPGPLDTPHGLAHVAVGLSALVTTVADTPAILVRFPEPEEVPHAALALIVGGYPAGAAPATACQVRYFTLERTQVSNPPGGPTLPRPLLGVVCEWTPDSAHHNFGILIPLDHAAADPFRAVCADILTNRSPGPIMRSTPNPHSPHGRTYTIPMRPGQPPDDANVFQ